MWDSDKGEQDEKKENTSRCDRSRFDGVDHHGRSDDHRAASALPILKTNQK